MQEKVLAGNVWEGIYGVKGAHFGLSVTTVPGVYMGSFNLLAGDVMNSNRNCHRRDARDTCG